MASVALHADLRTADAVRLLMLVDGVEAPILVIDEGVSAAGRDAGAAEIADLDRFEPSLGDLLDYNGAQRDVVGSVDGCVAPLVRISAASAIGVLDPASRCVEKRYRYAGARRLGRTGMTGASDRTSWKRPPDAREWIANGARGKGGHDE